MSIGEYFASDYRSARERFVAAARAAGASLSSYPLRQLRGPHQEPLTTDVACLGAPEARAALVIISATHGVEGFAGSGCQVGFCADRLYDALPPSVCTVLIHALNPHGFAWLRRVTEDGVDLNRNFVDFAAPRPSSPAYEELHPALVPTHWEGEARRNADMALQAYIGKHGLRAFQNAVTEGQYTQPQGLFYGGAGPTWSARTLLQILAERVPASARHLAVLDLHTGLGPAGYGEPIATAHNEAELKRARQWYGPELKSLAGDQSVSSELSGTMADGVARAFPDRERTFVALEFGTRPMQEVLTALRGDHWFHAYGQERREQRAGLARAMRDAFYCEAPWWQAAVYGRTADFILRAGRGLAELLKT